MESEDLAPYFIKGLFRSRALPKGQHLIAWKIEYLHHTKDWGLYYWFREPHWHKCTQSCISPGTAASAVGDGRTNMILWDEAGFHDSAEFALDQWDRFIPDEYLDRAQPST